MVLIRLGKIISTYLTVIELFSLTVLLTQQNETLDSAHEIFKNWKQQ